MSGSLGELTDDELYALFIQRLGGAESGVVEITPGVIHYPGDQVHNEAEDWAEIHITPEQLRRSAWCEDNYYDDTHLFLTPTAEDPVAMGINVLTDTVEEHYATLWEGEHYIVWFRGGLHRSTRPELPPLRAPMPSIPDAGSGWFSYEPLPDDLDDQDQS